MKIYGTKNVLEATLDRLRFLFDEFPVVVASVSGGKDSAVIFNLCLQVAKEKKRLPLPVLWLDQETDDFEHKGNLLSMACCDNALIDEITFSWWQIVHVRPKPSQKSVKLSLY